MEGDSTSIAVLVIGIVAIVGVIVAMARRSESLLSRWAAEHGYRITRSRPALFYRGPFFWSSKSQTVFHITAVDAEGLERSGWARCGSWLLGVAADTVEVRWDDAIPE